MARRDVNIDDEKRSYSAIFLLAVGLLLAGAVWSVWDDNIARRPWKYHQAEFSEREQDKVRLEIKKEDEHLASDAAYQQALKDLTAARQRLDGGDTAARLATLEAELKRVNVQYSDADLALRIVKSQLEEAWYGYETAELEHRPTDAARQRIDDLDTKKVGIQKTFDDFKARVEQITKEVSEVRSEVKALEDKVKTMTGERERLVQKLENLTLKVGPFQLPKIPKIQQVVLEDFERNNFDKPIPRVDRCESCHTGINKAGFEVEGTPERPVPQPYRTHPNQKLLLGNHPSEKFGCTPCHQGQGPAVNSPEQAHGNVKHWDQPLLEGIKVQASCIKCHANVARLEGADVIAHGEKLFEELGCHGCHLVEGYEDLQKVGPYLRRIGAKVDPAWLVRWVKNPHEFRPKTRMPNFLLNEEEATAVAAYLLDATKADSDEWLANRPAPSGVDPGNATLVAHGKELVDTLGCRGCHGIEADESPALLGENKDIAPNLSGIAEKTDARWLYYWIKGPRDYSPVSRMPSLRLSDDEARAIVSFLLTLGEKKPNSELVAQLNDPKAVERGKALVRKYGCYGCHDLTGMESESRSGAELTTFGSKTLEELFFGNHTDIPTTWDDWTFNKLKTPRTYATERIEQLMPQFDFADKDIKALRVFLASRTDLKYPARFRAGNPVRAQREVTGRRLVTRYNCVGCHIIDGKGGAIRARYEQLDQLSLAPPILNGEGTKAQANWLYGFVKEPVPIRPWLKVRMPTFGLSDKEATGVVEYFAALDAIDTPYVHITDSKIPPENLEAGKILTSSEYFGCFSCHQQGDKKPEGPPEGWAPDLAMARERLNPEWIITWLHDPQKLQPGTKMPAFFPGGPDDVLGGNDERQIQALRDYVVTLGKLQKTQVAHTGTTNNGQIQ